jgi:hypothetical protein
VEAVVEEDDRSELSEHDSDVFVAGTTFRLADGSEWPGLCSPGDPSGLDYLQPVMLVDGRHLSLWSEVPPEVPLFEAVPQALGRKVLEVFPLSFVCHVPVDGTLVSGTIEVRGALPNQVLQLTVNLPPSGRSDDRS